MSSECMRTPLCHPPSTGIPHPPEWGYLLLLLPPLPLTPNGAPAEQVLGLPNTQKNVRLAGPSPSLASSKLRKLPLPTSKFLPFTGHPALPAGSHPPALTPDCPSPQQENHRGSCSSDPRVPLPTAERWASLSSWLWGLPPPILAPPLLRTVFLQTWVFLQPQ